MKWMNIGPLLLFVIFIKSLKAGDGTLLQVVVQSKAVHECKPAKQAETRPQPVRAATAMVAGE